MKTSNEAIALEWTLACTGLKLCPSFNARSSEGDYRHIRHGTKPERAVCNSLRLTKRRGLCAGEVTWKRTGKTPFVIPHWKAASSQIPKPRKVRFSDDICWSKRGATGSQSSQKGYASDITGLSRSKQTTSLPLGGELRMKLNRTSCVKERWCIAGLLKGKVNNDTAGFSGEFDRT